MYFYIDTIRGNSVFTKNAVRSEKSYTAEEFEKLQQGYEIPVVFDDSGIPIEWECMSDDDE